MSDNIYIYFLGTSSSVPTKERNLSSLLIKYKGVNYLFDTPENVQQQIMKTDNSIQKIKHIFITHIHGDHIFGILGMIATMQMNQREDDLNIYLPKGYKDDLKNLINASKLNILFNINIKEVQANTKIKLDDLFVSAVKLKHSVLTYGYHFKIYDKIGKFNKQKALKLNIPKGPLFQKLKNGKTISINGKKIKPKDVVDYNFKKIGKSITYLTDTYVLSKVPPIIKNTDILIHESSFLKKDKDKAKEKLHSVAEDVGKFAKKANANKLFITHISSRYKDVSLIEKEVKKNFSNTKAPNDFDFFVIEDYTVYN
jgi:ribonuclease Z